MQQKILTVFSTSNFFFFLNSIHLILSKIETKGVSESFKKYLILAHNKGIEINEKYKVTDTADELTQKGLFLYKK